MSYHLGVDLGTTYSAAALARNGRAQVATLDTRSVSVPSVVYLGSDELLVGQAAARRSLTEPSRVAREFKRRVGDPTPLLLGGSPVSAELLMARLADWIVRQVAEGEGGPPAGLALTHPANWGEYKLDLLRQGLHHVGLEVDHLIPEPVAAASFYASERDLAAGSVVAVYDLGGGTFDAAVVRVDDAGFRIIGRPDGIERLGGIDFDHAVFRHVAMAIDLDVDALDLTDPSQAAAVEQLRQSCVDAKEALSSDTDVSILVMLPNLHTTVRLTRSELEAMVRPALEETLIALRRAVASAEVAVDDLHAVLLVGGSSRIPLIAQMVMAELGRPAAVDARPKEAISLGAALVASQAAGQAEPVVAASASPVSQPTAPLAVASAPLASPPVSTPIPGTPATPRTTRPGSSRSWLAAALVVLIAVAGVTALILAQRGGDDERSGDTTTTTTTASTTTTTVDETTTTSDGTSGTGEGEAPLPGDDWNDEARGVFVDTLAAETDFASNAELVGVDPEELAGCVYDEISASVSFETFNEAWTAENVDPAHPGVAAMQPAALTCATRLAGA